MDGGNLRDGCMEVAFEQWTEPGQNVLCNCSIQSPPAVDSNGIPPLWETVSERCMLMYAERFPY